MARIHYQIGHFLRHLLLDPARESFMNYLRRVFLKGKKREASVVHSYLKRCPITHHLLPTPAILGFSCPHVDQLQQTHDRQDTSHDASERPEAWT